MTEPCYGDFAKIYDPMMGGRYVRAWWQWFKNVPALRIAQPRSVADLACGTGKAALRLARPGKRTLFLVDRSQGMLDMAQARLPQARCLCQDMTALQLPESVDLAVCVFGGLNYLGTLKNVERFSRKVRRQLKPGGFFSLMRPPPFF
jgi:ubiquinone/menaquinone biosynthesis C-methylase UbiE